MIGGNWNKSPTKTTCFPPKGMLVLNTMRRHRSIPSTISHLTIDTSSTMIVSVSSRIHLFSYESTVLVCGPMACIGKPKKECIVCPPTVIAAMPVGANTKQFLLVSSWMRLIKVVLPVPAFPVMKRQLLVFATRSNAFCCSAFCRSSVEMVFSISSSFVF